MQHSRLTCLSSRLSSRCLFPVLACLPLLVQAAPQPAYTPVALIPFTPGQGSGVAMAINNQGMVCGLSSGPTGAFCWRDGQLTEMQPLPGDDNVAVMGINARGQAVGLSQSTGTFRRRAVVFVDGVAQEVAIPQATGSTASGINDAGDIVGSYTGRDSERVAFLYRHGAVQDLGTLGHARPLSDAADINNRGQIVGYSLTDTPTEGGGYFLMGAFLYERGGMRALATPAGYGSIAAKVNERGQVVGRLEPNDGSWESWRAALWDKGQLKVLLDQASDARGINNRGQVVGGVLTGNGGFLYEPGKGTRSLNDLIDTSTGWNIQYAQAINDRGQIVGFACKDDLCGPVLMNPSGKRDGD